ncbi:unnamed protein product [Sphagnum balticum]
MKTIIARTSGRLRRISKAIATASHSPSILMEAAPSIGGTEDAAEDEHFGERKHLEEDIVEEEEVGCQNEEANDGAYDSQKADHPKIFKEERFAQTVPRRENHRR